MQRKGIVTIRETINGQWVKITGEMMDGHYALTNGKTGSSLYCFIEDGFIINASTKHPIEPGKYAFRNINYYRTLAKIRKTEQKSNGISGNEEGSLGSGQERIDSVEVDK